MIKFLDLQQVTAKYQDEISEAVGRVVNSGWYLQGSANAQFEADYAKFIGTQYCVGCANGLDALIWIFRAYKELGRLQPGDEILVPANTFIPRPVLRHRGPQRRYRPLPESAGQSLGRALRQSHDLRLRLSRSLGRGQRRHHHRNAHIYPR